MTATRKSQNEYDSNKLVQNVSAFRLVFLSLMVMTPYLMSGMVVAFTSIALSQMGLDLDETSWFGSIISITCPFGELFIGLIVDKFGRRISLLSSVVPNILGWFLLANGSASLTQIYLGRAVHGFAQGAGQLPPVLYAAECITVNNARIRGSVGTWSSASIVTGALLTFCFSVVLPYDRIALVCGLVCTLWLLLIVKFIPESPAWLHRRGRVGDAEIAQRRLGIKQPILQKSVGAGHTTTDVESDSCSSYSAKGLLHYLGHMRRREVYKPLIITTTFFFFYEFSGLYCLCVYMVDVIAVPAWKVDPYLLPIIAQAFQLVGSLFLTFVLPFGGVRLLCCVSFLGVSMGFIALAVSVSLESSSASNIFNYLHLGSVCVILLTSQLGAFPMPYAILGEMFPMGAKGYASLSLLADSAFSFIVLKLFPYALAWSRVAIFFVFSGICACGAVFVVTCLPETVGKSMDEIEEGFKKSNEK